MSTPRDRSVFELASIAVGRWRVLVVVPLIFAAVAAAVYLWQGPAYIATSRFLPQNPGGTASQLTGLAERFGLNVSGAAGNTSSEFYVALVRSPEILQQLVDTRFTFATSTDPDAETLSGTLAELYEIEEDTEVRVRRAVVRRLLEDVTAQAEPETGLVQVEVEAPWPGLAVAVNERLLDLINAFNVDQRRSLASEERKFVEQRREAARQELLAAEAELQEFVSSNRRFSPSSELMVEQARLQRQVDLRQQVYLTLAQAFEQARIDEVRTTPLVNVVEAPGTYPRRAPGSLPLVVVLAMMVGFAAATGYILLADLLRREREAHPQAYQALKEGVRHAAHGLRPGGGREGRRQQAEHDPALVQDGKESATKGERFAFADAERSSKAIGGST